MRRWSGGLAVVTLLAGGCGGDVRDAPLASDTLRAAAPAPPPPTQAQIAHILAAAMRAGGGTAQLGRERGEHPDAQRFAATVAADRAAVAELLTELLEREDITLAEHEQSRAIERSAAAAHTRLQRSTGRAFDTAYVDYEVAYLRALLALIDDRLAPAAQGTEIGTLLSNVRPAIDAHLVRARQLAIELPEAPVPADAADVLPPDTGAAPTR